MKLLRRFKKYFPEIANVPYGERGYLIDNKGDITPIEDMYGHEAFVKRRSSTHLSVFNYVADNGWVYIATIGNMMEIILCSDTITKAALSATSKVISTHHRDAVISLDDYDRENDIEAPIVKLTTYRRIVTELIKLKSRAL